MTTSAQTIQVTRELIDRFIPEHGRSSCSDRDVINGFGSNGTDQPPRCNRCALLEMLNDGELPELNRLQLHVDVQFRRLPWVKGNACLKCRQAADGPNFCNNCGADLR